MVTPYAAFLALCLQATDWSSVYINYYGDRWEDYGDLQSRYAKELHHTLGGNEEMMLIAQHEAMQAFMDLSGPQVIQRLKACRKKVFNEEFEFGELPQATVGRTETKAFEEAFTKAEEEAKALEAELAFLNALAIEKSAAKVIDAMTTRITRSWKRPPNYKGGVETLLRISLASNGELIDTTVIGGSGDTLFNRSAIDAVKRAAPFDEVKQFDEETFEDKFRSITVKFRPER